MLLNGVHSSSMEGINSFHLHKTDDWGLSHIQLSLLHKALKSLSQYKIIQIIRNSSVCYLYNFSFSLCHSQLLIAKTPWHTHTQTRTHARTRAHTYTRTQASTHTRTVHGAECYLIFCSALSRTHTYTRTHTEVHSDGSVRTFLILHHTIGGGLQWPQLYFNCLPLWTMGLIFVCPCNRNAEFLQ
jgi:hypothetical protein